MLAQEIERRSVPSFLPETAEAWPEKRLSILNQLQAEEYGFLPPACEVTVEETLRNEKFLGGKILYVNAMLTAHLPQGDFTFPAAAYIPNAKQPVPAIVFISFSDQIPSKNLPAEEIADNGVAVFNLYYKSVVPDDMNAMSAELPMLLYGAERKPHDAGAIALWAWASSRVLDWALTFPQIQADNVSVVGQSRLGKTALLAGAMDERFAVAYSNESGCCGAAISRDKIGETVDIITERFPYWFCTNFLKYANGHDHELPFDQDALIAAIAPRRAYVASAWEDKWSDPESEYLACLSAGRVWNMLGMDGFVAPDRAPKPGEAFPAGDVGYHVRPGYHTMTRDDWHQFLPFIKRKI